MRTLDSQIKSDRTANFVEIVNACQGLIVVTMGAAIFVCLPFVAKDLRETWNNTSLVILGVGATLMRSDAGNKTQINQRGNFEKFEGGIVSQTNEYESEPPRQVKQSDSY